MVLWKVNIMENWVQNWKARHSAYKQQFVINTLSSMFGKHTDPYFKLIVLYGVLYVGKNKSFFIATQSNFFFLFEGARKLFCLVFHLGKIASTLIWIPRVADFFSIWFLFYSSADKDNLYVERKNIT